MAFLELLARIRLEGADKAKESLKGVKDAATDAGGGVRSLASSLGIMAAAAGAAQVASSAFAAAVDYDSLVRGLSTVATATDSVGAQLARLKEVARAPGLGFEEAIQGSIRLQSAGLSARLAERSLAAFGNAIASVGGGKAELDGVTTALSQMASKGTVSAEEINQIAERVPQIRKLLADAFGTADTEKIQKMGLTSAAVIERITAAAEKLPKATGGLRNNLDNLQDDLRTKVLIPLGQIGAAIATVFGPIATSGINNLGNLLSGLQQNMRGVAVAVSLAVSAFTFMASVRVITGVLTLAKALREVYQAVKAIGIAQAVAQAIATRGVGLPLIIGAGAAAAAAGVATFSALDKGLGPALKDASGGLTPGGKIPAVGLPGSDSGGGAGGIAGALKGAFPDLAQFGVGVVTELRNRNERILASIEKNTRDTADVLSLRKQGIGGGSLAQIGVTAAELRGFGGSGNAPGRQDFGARPASSELERVQRRLIRQEMGRQNGTGRRVV